MHGWSLEKFLVLTILAAEMMNRDETNTADDALPAGSKALTTPAMIEAVGGKVWH